MRVSQGKIKDSLFAELGFEFVSFLEHLSNPGGLFQRFLDFHGYEQKKTPDKVIEVDGLFLHETAQNDTIRQDRAPGAKEQRIIGVDRKSKISLENSGEPVDNRRESRSWHGAKSRVSGWVKFLFPEKRSKPYFASDDEGDSVKVIHGDMGPSEDSFSSSSLHRLGAGIDQTRPITRS